MAFLYSFSFLLSFIGVTTNKSLVFLDASWHSLHRGHELTHVSIASDYFQSIRDTGGRLEGEVHNATGTLLPSLSLLQKAS
jgi:hypothetical protein